MSRRPSQLEKTLRAIVLSTPFLQALALPACCLEVTGPQPCDGEGPLPCETICDQIFTGVHCHATDCNLCSDSGMPSVECSFNVCGGRRPSRLRPAPRSRTSADPLGILWRDVAAAKREAFVELLNSTIGRIPVAHVTVAGLPHPVAARRPGERMGEALLLG